MITPDNAALPFADAIMAPASWPDALQAVANACQATMATLVNCGRRGELVCSRAARPAIDAYLTGRSIPDSRIGRVRATLAGGFRTDLDDFSPRELAHDAYYQDFLAQHDVRWHAVAALSDGDDRILVSLKRSARQGPFERGDVERLDRLLPLWRGAARQAALVARSRFEGELAAFARLRRGALALAADGRIVAVNDCVFFGDGLQSEDGRLGAALADDRAALARAIGCAATGATPDAVVVRRPSGKRPYVVDTIGLPPAGFDGMRTARLVAVITDLQHQRQPRARLLQQAFALTPREAALAVALCDGATIRQAAAALQISEGHARQRMKLLFAKTSTRRQAELLALLARLD